jgi:hypothetical protein
MKKLMFSLILLCPFALFGQTESINQFYSKYSGMEEVTSINLSGELLNFVLGDEEEDKNLKKAKITGLRVLLMGEEIPVDKQDYKQFIKNVKKESFEELICMKDGGEAVDFHLREKDGMITNLLITVRGSDGFVLLSIEGNFDYEDLNELDIDMHGADQLRKLPKKREDIKRA